MGDLITPLWDTPKDQQVSISLDIGIIPGGQPSAGRYVITIQAWPLTTHREAKALADAMREALGSRLGIKLESQG